MRASPYRFKAAPASTPADALLAKRIVAAEPSSRATASNPFLDPYNRITCSISPDLSWPTPAPFSGRRWIRYVRPPARSRVERATQGYRAAGFDGCPQSAPGPCRREVPRRPLLGGAPRKRGPNRPTGRFFAVSCAKRSSGENSPPGRPAYKLIAPTERRALRFVVTRFCHPIFPLLTLIAA